MTNRLVILITNSSIPFKLFFLIALTLAVYWQDFVVIAADSLNELSNYLIAIPFILGVLLYKNRKVIRAKACLQSDSRNNDMILGGFLSTTAFLIHWVGSYTFLSLEYHLFSLPIFVAGTLILLYNRNILPPLIFPLAMLLFLEPFPSYLTNYLGSAFTYWSAAASLNLLSLVRVPAYFTIISGTPVIAINSLNGDSISFGVTTECSGIYSLTGFAVFAAFAGYVSIGSFSKRIALFLFGFPLVYLLNILRVTAIVGVGYQLGSGSALQIFHVLAGSTLIFITTLILLILGERFWHLRFLPAKTQHTCQSRNSSWSLQKGFCEKCSKVLGSFHSTVKKPWIATVVLIILVTALFLSSQIPVYAIAQGPPSFAVSQLAENPANLSILPQISHWNYQYVYRDPQVERTLGLDLALAYVYSTNTTSTQTLVNVLVELSSTPIHHTWEGSLIVFPTRHNLTVANVLIDNDVQISGSPFVPGRFLTFIPAGNNITETVVYWNQQIPIKGETGFGTEYAQFSILTVDDDLNANGLVSPPYESSTSQNQLKNLLLPFAQSIISYWRPQQTHALLTNIFGQMGLVLMGVFGFAPLALFTGFEAVKANRRTVSNKKLYSRITNHLEKDVLEAVKLANKDNEITNIDAISKQMRQHSTGSNQLDHLTIYEILDSAEEAKLVKRVIRTLNGEPYVSWKSNF